MNAKTFITALSLAVVGSAAMASEASPSPEPVSTLSRAEVRAEINAPSAVLTVGEATVFVDAATLSSVSRDEVRAQARAAAREASFNDLYVG
jgi:hypothetical protein